MPASATKGSLDSLVLTELAWDEEEFARRMIENEILYYTREQAPDEARRLHYLLIDASASMRGDRQVFARGLAIALGKKLQLAGEEVWMRFFDSRLYDVQRARPGQLPAAYLLGFKGERGRNPARVFAQLATELALLRARDQRDPVVHLITHAALHVPRQLVQEVRRQAHLFGVFILPSGGELDLEYLDLLEGHAVVDHATLSAEDARARRRRRRSWTTRPARASSGRASRRRRGRSVAGWRAPRRAPSVRLDPLGLAASARRPDVGQRVAPHGRRSVEGQADAQDVGLVAPGEARPLQVLLDGFAEDGLGALAPRHHGVEDGHAEARCDDAGRHLDRVDEGLVTGGSRVGAAGLVEEPKGLIEALDGGDRVVDLGEPPGDGEGAQNGGRVEEAVHERRDLVDERVAADGADARERGGHRVAHLEPEVVCRDVEELKRCG